MLKNYYKIKEHIPKKKPKGKIALHFRENFKRKL
jgi:hypothetical protein